MEVVGLDPFAENQSKPRGGRADARRDASSSSGRTGNRANRNGSARDGAATRDAGGFTRFVVTWGDQTGATPSRILSHICRRSGLESSQVGAIQISTKSSTVDIARDAADVFETRTKRPDKRDPGIIVSRDEGPSGSPKRFKARGDASGQAVASSGPAGDARHPKAKRSSRPVHLKQKHQRQSTSR
jgi:hypothetical protein